MEQQPEEFEHIPWSELTSAHQSERSKMLYLGAGALLVLALGAVVARSFGGSAGATQPEIGGPPPDTSFVTSSTTTPAPVVAATIVTPPALLSEADLMATLPVENGARPAVARAEWFVVDYFTSDLDPLAAAPIVGALPPGVALPDLPHDRGTPPISFVEWARAIDADDRGNGEFAVTVAYRTIGSTDEGGFIRQPVRAVIVPVAVGPDGGTTVMDLPAPAEFTPGPLVAGWPQPAAELPDAVVGAALQHAARWGPFPQLVEGARDGDGWRVVVSVEDEVGNRWPLVMVFDDTGARIEA